MHFYSFFVIVRKIITLVTPQFLSQQFFSKYTYLFSCHCVKQIWFPHMRIYKEKYITRVTLLVKLKILNKDELEV